MSGPLDAVDDFEENGKESVLSIAEDIGRVSAEEHPAANDFLAKGRLGLLLGSGEGGREQCKTACQESRESQVAKMEERFFHWINRRNASAGDALIGKSPARAMTLPSGPSKRRAGFARVQRPSQTTLVPVRRRLHKSELGNGLRLAEAIGE